MKIRLLALTLSTLLLSACAFSPASQEVASVDLGSGLPADACVLQQSRPTITVLPLVIAPQYESTGLAWREGDQGQPKRYTRHQWSVTPDQLLDQRFRQCFAQAGPVVSRIVGVGTPILTINVERFEQVFESQKSQGVLVLRTTLVQDRAVVASKLFETRVSAATLDALGGAQALRMATNQSATEVNLWLSQVLR